MSTARLTADIAAAYLEANRVPATDVPDLIRSIRSALEGLGREEVEPAPATSRATAAQVRKSITPDALISFEDGRPYRMLRRHLATLGLTPEAYRAKWGLPADYPMVAPSYSAARSTLAKSFGLGRQVRGQGAKSQK